MLRLKREVPAKVIGFASAVELGGSMTWSCQHHGCPGAIHSVSCGCLLRPSPVKESCTLPNAEDCTNSKVCIHYAAAIQRVKSYLQQGSQGVSAFVKSYSQTTKRLLPILGYQLACNICRKAPHRESLTS